MDFRIQGLIELESRVHQGVQQATSALGELNDVVLNSWWGMQNLAAAFAGFGATVGFVLQGAIRETIAWEEALANVQRTVSETSDYDWETALDMSAIEQDIRRIAASTPLAAAAIAEIASNAGALGIAKENIGEFTQTVADLAATTDLTEERAAKLFARVSSPTADIEPEDKMFVFMVAHGMVNDLATFRRFEDQQLAVILDGQGVQQSTQSASGN